MKKTKKRQKIKSWFFKKNHKNKRIKGNIKNNNKRLFSKTTIKNNILKEFINLNYLIINLFFNVQYDKHLINNL